MSVYQKAMNLVNMSVRQTVHNLVQMSVLQMVEKSENLEQVLVLLTVYN
jgi:hypothetical protein